MSSGRPLADDSVASRSLAGDLDHPGVALDPPGVSLGKHLLYANENDKHQFPVEETRNSVSPSPTRKIRAVRVRRESNNGNRSDDVATADALGRSPVRYKSTSQLVTSGFNPTGATLELPLMDVDHDEPQSPTKITTNNRLSLSPSPRKKRIVRVYRDNNNNNDMESKSADDAVAAESAPVSPTRMRIVKVVRCETAGNGIYDSNVDGGAEATRSTTTGMQRGPLLSNSFHDNISSHSVGSHCSVGVPFAAARNNSTNNIQHLPPVEIKSSESHIQGLRLLRVLLGEASVTINRETVDRALQKYSDLLRLYVQQKQLLPSKEQPTSQQQDKQTIITQKKMIAKLEADLRKQKNVMQTALQIKDVEIDIRTKERDQKAVKIQQLSWRLAKERTAAKEKADCVAAAVVSSSSFITNSAVKAENAVSAPNETTQGFEKVVETTVAVLRGKDKLLEQLLESQTCGVHQPVGPDNEADHSVCIGSMDDLKQESKSGKQQNIPQLRVVEDDGASAETPIMGRSASDVMVLHGAEFLDRAGCQKLPANSASVETLLSTSTSLDKVSRRSPQLQATGSKEPGNAKMPAKVFELKQKLEEAEQQLHGAKETITALNEEKEEMEADFEETLQESQAKIYQLKGVLIACNKRRLSAEERLREVGKYEEFIEMSKKQPEESVEEIVRRETAVGKKGPCGSFSSVNTAELIKQQTEVENLKRRLAETRAQHDKLERELKNNEMLCQSALTRNAELESQLSKLQEQLTSSQQENASLQTRYSVKLVEARTAQSEARVEEYSAKLEDATNALRRSDGELVECNERRQEAEQKLRELAETSKKQIEELVDELVQREMAASQLLSETRAQNAEIEHEVERKVGQAAALERMAKLESQLAQLREQLDKAQQENVSCEEEYSVMLQDARSALQQSEATADEYLARLEGARNSLQRSESRTNGYLAEMAEIKILLQRSETTASEYSAKLGEVMVELQQSETRAREYFAEFEEARILLKQSEIMLTAYTARLEDPTENSARRLESRADKCTTQLHEARNVLQTCEEKAEEDITGSFSKHSMPAGMPDVSREDSESTVFAESESSDDTFASEKLSPKATTKETAVVTKPSSDDELQINYAVENSTAIPNVDSEDSESCDSEGDGTTDTALERSSTRALPEVITTTMLPLDIALQKNHEAVKESKEMSWVDRQDSDSSIVAESETSEGSEIVTSVCSGSSPQWAIKEVKTDDLPSDDKLQIDHARAVEAPAGISAEVYKFSTLVEGMMSGNSERLTPDFSEGTCQHIATVVAAACKPRSDDELLIHHAADKSSATDMTPIKQEGTEALRSDVVIEKADEDRSEIDNEDSALHEACPIANQDAVCQEGNSSEEDGTTFSGNANTQANWSVEQPRHQPREEEYVNRIAVLEKELVEKHLLLKEIAALVQENKSTNFLLEEARASLQLTLAEVGVLKEKLTESELNLNEAVAKLIFLRDTVLAVVVSREQAVPSIGGESSS